MNSGQGDGQASWVPRWAPVSSPPPTADDVLVLLRDFDGKLIYRVGHYYPEEEPTDEDDGESFWHVEAETYWPEERLIEWTALPQPSDPGQ
jgi:hypothetical protein